ncbi:hypothetical protein [Brevundimonas diminuta]|uniref:hypothetical protein n=1 Tax=Brevundimonas diminuta TaxID=293 RepID=UPI003CFC0FCD
MTVRRPDHIRGSEIGAPGQNISQAQVEASRRMQWVRDRLPPRDFRLLEHLLVNGSAHKGSVAQDGGGDHRGAQGRGSDGSGQVDGGQRA